MFLPLPPAEQTWAHAVSSWKDLTDALNDPHITAIEADVLMGSLHRGGPHPSDLIPIMAHPPSKVSDLSCDDFVRACVQHGRKHIKLDFKDLDAAAQCAPVVRGFAERLRQNGQAVLLNADIMNGPGRRYGGVPVPADKFLEVVASHCPGAPLSLGWRVRPVVRDWYTEDDVARMRGVYESYTARLDSESAGVVFPVSLRLATKSVSALSTLVLGARAIPSSQLLVWTGAGELPPPSSTLLEARTLFQKAGLSDRVGYDCRVAEGRTSGIINDIVVYFGNVVPAALDFVWA